MRKAAVLPLILSFAAAAHNPLLPRPREIHYGAGRFAVKGAHTRFAAAGAAEDRFTAAQLSAALRVPVVEGPGPAIVSLAGFPLLMAGARFTQDQLRTIIRYARERHIDVLPNLELYGHMHDLFRVERFAEMGGQALPPLESMTGSEMGG